jgi:hypothetical protein
MADFPATERGLEQEENFAFDYRKGNYTSTHPVNSSHN